LSQNQSLLKQKKSTNGNLKLKTMNAINFFATPFIEIYEEIWEQPTLALKIWQGFLLAWVASLFTLFVIGWTYLVFNFITNPSSFENATFGVFDTLG
jgi:hypothetical protein